MSFFTRLREKNNSKDLQAFLFPATKITHIFSFSVAEVKLTVFLTLKLMGKGGGGPFIFGTHQFVFKNIERVDILNSASRILQC